MTADAGGPDTVSLVLWPDTSCQQRGKNLNTLRDFCRLWARLACRVLRSSVISSMDETGVKCDGSSLAGWRTGIIAVRTLSSH
jgi:hypothetical protein